MTNSPPLVELADVSLEGRVSLQLNLLQDALANARFLVGEGADPKLIYDILDRIEFLPSLIASAGREESQLFYETIIGLADANPTFNATAEKARILSTEPI
ncbi:MAG: hypothetical protein JNK93_15390 [Planctomycetia bacterium]|nr:hypothetical protein [Planctomycetia bacterium]